MEENVIVITSLGEGSEILASLERRLDLDRTALHRESTVLLVHGHCIVPAQLIPDNH
jgi:hypothetical protein